LCRLPRSEVRFSGNSRPSEPKVSLGPPQLWSVTEVKAILTSLSRRDTFLINGLRNSVSLLWRSILGLAQVGVSLSLKDVSLTRLAKNRRRIFALRCQRDIDKA